MVKTSKKMYNFSWTSWPLKMGRIGCPETSLITNQTSRNIPQKRKSRALLNLLEWTWQFSWHNHEIAHHLLRFFCSVWVYLRHGPCITYTCCQCSAFHSIFFFQLQGRSLWCLSSEGQTQLFITPILSGQPPALKQQASRFPLNILLIHTAA